MAKTKQDWIKEINAFGAALLGEITQEELLTFNVGQLKALKLEIEKEVAESAAPQAEEKEGDAGSESKFISMCGSEFDPKKSGSCAKDCSKDFPEAYKACSENFKVKPEAKGKAKKAKAPVGGGKTRWNHVANSQAGKIDEVIITGEPKSLKEIAEFANAKEPRTLAHMQHLVADWGIEILYTTRKDEAGKDETIFFWSEKDKRRKGDILDGKSAYRS